MRVAQVARRNNTKIRRFCPFRQFSSHRPNEASGHSAKVPRPKLQPEGHRWGRTTTMSPPPPVSFLPAAYAFTPSACSLPPVRFLGRLSALVMLTLALSPRSATSQTDVTGVLHGVVRDSAGAAVPDVLVVVARADGSFIRRSWTDEQGPYPFSLLPPGRANPPAPPLRPFPPPTPP